jgi:pimeloyl-ACP methyl ester carboxylesterase
MTDRIPFILVPSLLCTASVWGNQTNHLKDIAECFVPDTTRYDTMTAIAQSILHSAPPKFALAGLSMGGYVAFEIMRQAPERVLKLAIVDSSAREDTPAQKEHRRLSIASARIGQFKGVTPRLLPTLIHPDRVKDKALADLIMSMAQFMGRDSFINQQTAIMNRIDSRPCLPNITCPVLALGGRQDVLTPPEVLQEIANSVPNGRLEIIEHCGHLPPLELPETVNMFLRQWLLL